MTSSAGFLVGFSLVLLLLICVLNFLKELTHWVDRIPWSFWVSSYEGVGEEMAVLWVKNVVHLFHCRIDYHSIVRADKPNNFHSHPAWAIRWVRKGGYVEEVVDPFTGEHYFEFIRAGHIGIIGPNFRHRVDRLLNEDTPSESWWFRGPVVASILIGQFIHGSYVEYEVQPREK